MNKDKLVNEKEIDDKLSGFEIILTIIFSPILIPIVLVLLLFNGLTDIVKAILRFLKWLFFLSIIILAIFGLIYILS